jgi:uncharacterized protein YdiU (UPF0061 family)
MVALTFDNSFAREMPADPRSDNRPRGVRGALYSRVSPAAVRAPSMLAWSRDVAQMLDLGSAELAPDAAQSWAKVLSGNEPLQGMEPIATRYGGHQFGHWAGQLGDGRAMTLGEVVTKHHGRQELQLKGAGMTPYSRRADGRAVLRSSLREFVCSEAMFHLGVPTTRALSLVTTGDPVMRDMFYDGNAEYEPGAVVCRVAPSFLRFGHFEVLAADGEIDLLGKLLSYLLRQHYPTLPHAAVDPDTVLAFLAEIAERTVRMVTHWQRVGFVHGVMNTDNMSALGLTIDYGPYGFLEPFDPHWTPNTTDAGGRRYRYGAQPNIALWNVARLAEALHLCWPKSSKSNRPSIGSRSAWRRQRQLCKTRCATCLPPSSGSTPPQPTMVSWPRGWGTSRPRVQTSRFSSASSAKSPQRHPKRGSPRPWRTSSMARHHHRTWACSPGCAAFWPAGPPTAGPPNSGPERCAGRTPQLCLATGLRKRPSMPRRTTTPGRCTA